RALREDEPALFGARLQDLEDELLLTHAGRARHVEAFGDLGQRADAHVLERRKLELFRRGRRGCGWGSGPGGRRRRGRRRCFGRVRLHPELLSRSISVHSWSSPSPVTAETGSTEVSKTDSSSHNARIRSPRPSLSILVVTTAALLAAACTHCQAARSLASPGCRASTSSSAAGARSNTTRTIASNSAWLDRRASAGLKAPGACLGARAYP